MSTPQHKFLVAPLYRSGAVLTATHVYIFPAHKHFVPLLSNS